MGDWRRSTWGKEISLEYGKGLRGYSSSEGSVRVYGANGPVGWTTTPLAPGPGIILGRKGAYRGVNFSKAPFSVIDTAYYILLKGELDMRWAYYAIIYYQLGKIDDGSPIPSTTRSAVYVRELNIPPLAEQRAIASILGALDDKIDLNRRMNETLEAIARVIFKDWFVDFGPTQAKIEGRAPYFAQDIWDLFPALLDDEGKPTGWRKGTLADISTLNPESWSERNAPDRINYVDLANTKWGTIENIVMYEWCDAPSRARRILRPGDTIVGTVRPGNGSYSFINGSDLTGSTGFAVLRPDNQQQKSIVYCAVTSPDNIQRLTLLADGGAYPAVRPEIVASTGLILSTSQIFLEFSRLVDPLLMRVESNKAENETLTQTRDFLLPKLMSGEIRVKDVEKIVGEAS
ncbi:restriction endonuclease subunit S [Solidesulfovibrio sp. C21]|uniref:restriction endonuclease subunit S n=1 Tax=Solidesulfovibrio sp. C21 TaxID=3398613 RepID=UPI0039FD783F